jgi:transposase
MDGRKISHETLEHLRIRACQRIANGEPVSSVMASIGLSRQVGYEWMKTYRKHGIGGLKSKKAGGPKRRLGVRKLRQLRKWILSRDPRRFGFNEALWSLRIIAELVLMKFGVKLTLPGILKLLKHLGITPQKPLRRAYERDPQRIRDWQDVELPKIVKRAKRKGAMVLFLDEAGIRSDAQLGVTWGARGKTPVVSTSGQRQKVNAISAVSPKGEFRFKVFTSRFNAAFFINALKDFTKGIRRPCYFIVDGHPAHRAQVVRQFVRGTKGKIELYFLPPYAPDLNPDEFVWNHIKHHGLSRSPLRQNENLKARVTKDLKTLRRDKKLIKSFFLAKTVGYPS